MTYIIIACVAIGIIFLLWDWYLSFGELRVSDLIVLLFCGAGIGPVSILIFISRRGVFRRFMDKKVIKKHEKKNTAR